MFQQLRAQVVTSEEPSLVPSTHLAVPSCLPLCSNGSDSLSQPLEAPGKPIVYDLTCREDSIHIKFNCFKLLFSFYFIGFGPICPKIFVFLLCVKIELKQFG